MQPEPFSRLQPFRSHLLFNLPETYFFFKIDCSQSFNFHEKIEYRRLFSPKHKCFKKCDQLKAKKKILHRFLEISGDIAVDFTAKKAPVLFNAEGTLEARGKVI